MIDRFFFLVRSVDNLGVRVFRICGISFSNLIGGEILIGLDGDSNLLSDSSMVLETLMMGAIPTLNLGSRYLTFSSLAIFMYILCILKVHSLSVEVYDLSSVSLLDIK